MHIKLPKPPWTCLKDKKKITRYIQLANSIYRVIFFCYLFGGGLFQFGILFSICYRNGKEHRYEAFLELNPLDLSSSKQTVLSNKHQLEMATVYCWAGIAHSNGVFTVACHLWQIVDCK